MKRLICWVVTHRWQTRKGHDGIHWRCARCKAGHVTPYEES